MRPMRQQAVVSLIDQHYDEHQIEDIDRPYYRECVNCGHAFRKDQTALMDYKGRFFCDAKCILEREEGLAAQHEERRFQEYRDGGY
jgi:hypothetical protein